MVIMTVFKWICKLECKRLIMVIRFDLFGRYCLLADPFRFLIVVGITPRHRRIIKLRGLHPHMLLWLQRNLAII